jgi:hypothetical protein
MRFAGLVAFARMTARPTVAVRLAIVDRHGERRIRASHPARREANRADEPIPEAASWRHHTLA